MGNLCCSLHGIHTEMLAATIYGLRWESSGKRGLSSTGHAVLVLKYSSMAQPAWGSAGSHLEAWQLQLLAGLWLTSPGRHHGATVRTTSAFTAEKSLCHFLGAIALYHICKEGQKLDKSYLVGRNPPTQISNPGLLLKLLTTVTEKEAELPDLSLPPYS